MRLDKPESGIGVMKIESIAQSHLTTASTRIGFSAVAPKPSGYSGRKVARPRNSPRPAFQSQLLQSRTIDSRPSSTVIATGVSTEKPDFSSQRPFRRMNGATRFPLEGVRFEI